MSLWTDVSLRENPDLLELPKWLRLEDSDLTDI